MRKVYLGNIIVLAALMIDCIPLSDLFDDNDSHFLSLDDNQNSDSAESSTTSDLRIFDDTNGKLAEPSEFDDELFNGQPLLTSADCSQPINKRLEKTPAACPNDESTKSDLAPLLFRPSPSTKDPSLVPLRENTELCPGNDISGGMSSLATDIFCDSGRPEDRIFNEETTAYDLEHATPCMFLSLFLCYFECGSDAT